MIMFGQNINISEYIYKYVCKLMILYIFFKENIIICKLESEFLLCYYCLYFKEYSKNNVRYNWWEISF